MKTFLHFTTQLRESLNHSPRPGFNAQMKMAPASRVKELSNLTNVLPRRSAVLINFFQRNDEPHFIMIKRAIDESVHSGQIAFPGGKFENSDETLTTTALRESHEEIGLLPSAVNIIGQLSELYIPPSNYMVTPFVGYTENEPELMINEEVDQVLVVSLTALLKHENRKEEIIQHRQGQLKVPCFTLGGEIVWGATAMMLAEFIEIIND